MQIKFNLVLLTIWELSNWQLSARASRPAVLLNGIQTSHLNEFAMTARTDSRASVCTVYSSGSASVNTVCLLSIRTHTASACLVCPVMQMHCTRFIAVET